jgi:putative endonuclease
VKSARRRVRRSLGEDGWQLTSPQLGNMKYVYLIQSTPYPDKKYIGVTQDLKARLKSHNEGQSSHTSKFKPWKIVTYIAFSNESKAVEFEKYLKSGSGRAFAEKRLWDSVCSGSR